MLGTSPTPGSDEWSIEMRVNKVDFLLFFSVERRINTHGIDCRRKGRVYDTAVRM